MEPLTILSYPRTGRLWVAFLLGNLLAEERRDPTPPTYADLATLGIALDDQPVAADVPTRFVLSHSRDAAPERAVVVVRNLADTLRSFWYAVTVRRGLEINWPTFLRHQSYGAQAVIDWLNAVGGGLAGRDVHVIAYEALQADAAQALDALVPFARLQVTDEAIAEAVERSTFEALQASEIAHGMGAGPTDPPVPDGLRLRHGQMGDGVAACAGDDRDYLAQALAGLTPEGRALYGATGDPVADGAAADEDTTTAPADVTTEPEPEPAVAAAADADARDADETEPDQ